MSLRITQQAAKQKSTAAKKGAATPQENTSRQWQATFTKRMPSRIGTPLSSDSGGCSSN
jgi:hypothetical protein